MCILALDGVGLFELCSCVVHGALATPEFCLAYRHIFGSNVGIEG